MSNHCIECQKCCRSVNIPMEVGVGVSFVQFLMIRGMVVKHSVERRQVGIIDRWTPHTSVVVDVPCQHLGTDGCRIYAERPAECRAYECDDYKTNKT